MKKSYYVANDNGDLACHDCSREKAEDVLTSLLSADPENKEGWELFDSEDEEE